jgi:hypothetical protein
MSKLFYRGEQKQGTSSRSSLLLRNYSWQGRQDLNLRHPVLETGALPTELLPYIAASVAAGVNIAIIRQNGGVVTLRMGLCGHCPALCAFKRPSLRVRSW